MMANIETLETLSTGELQSLWKVYFGFDCPKYTSKSMMVGRIAYRIQEISSGGLKQSTIDTLIEYAKGERKPPPEQTYKGLEELETSSTKPEEQGFYLVGDQGVYLMPNSNDGKHNAQQGKDDGRFVIYATECDPTKLDFDTWWENKRASFGGDDGAEFIPLADINALIAQKPNGDNVVVSISETEFSMSCH